MEDLSKLSIEELKILAYDHMMASQDEMNLISDEIMKKEVAATNAVVPEVPVDPAPVEAEHPTE